MPPTLNVPDTVSLPVIDVLPTIPVVPVNVKVLALLPIDVFAAPVVGIVVFNVSTPPRISVVFNLFPILVAPGATVAVNAIRLILASP